MAERKVQLGEGQLESNFMILPVLNQNLKNRWRYITTLNPIALSYNLKRLVHEQLYTTATIIN